MSVLTQRVELLRGAFILYKLFFQKADILVDGVIPKNERLKIVDFSQPWELGVFTALIPAPEVGANIDAIVKPFQWQVSQNSKFFKKCSCLQLNF